MKYKTTVEICKHKIEGKYELKELLRKIEEVIQWQQKEK